MWVIIVFVSFFGVPAPVITGDREVCHALLSCEQMRDLKNERFRQNGLPPTAVCERLRIVK